ncbi:hypothetical protein FIBSPDRAFT_250228 [Athelia psychrophila]|uniref:Uncharacterized protein n=1 Tax=Athelia psychrophila TaxID=1759441 RepID=A0A165XWX9_9AGAM|nr:hypothetical protein FIBSPDRAFT_250228 [Fibularhizoctonia sp. CBS 109695]
MSPPVSYTNGAVIPTAPNGIPPSVYIQQLPPPSSLPLRVQHQSRSYLRSPRVDLCRSHNHLPRVLIQEASPPGASSPALAVHSAGVSYRVFPAPAYAAGARRCRSRILIRTTGMRITTALSSCSTQGAEWGCLCGFEVQPRPPRLLSAWGWGLKAIVFHWETTGACSAGDAAGPAGRGRKWEREQQRRQRRTQGRGRDE